MPSERGSLRNILKTALESTEALQAVEHHVEAFRIVADVFSRQWRDYDRAIMWLTDRRTHVDATIGNGTHGEDTPADMIVEHFFGFQPVGRSAGN